MSTPGPWQAWQEPGNPGLYTVIDAHDEFVAWTRDLLKPDDECEANAMLIAAAPDLYQALVELMHAEHPPFRGPLQYDSTREDAWDHARAAIAKARPARARMGA